MTVIPDSNSYSAPVSSHNINIKFDLKTHTIDAVDHLKIYSRG